MEMRDMVVVVLVASLFGALAGFVVGRYSALDAFEAKVAVEGISVSEVRWVDERGRARLSVSMPAEAVSQLSPYVGSGEAVISITDAQGNVQAAAVIGKGVINRASGY
jgi:hypothetical protein